jgi:hypothetical protein
VRIYRYYVPHVFTIVIPSSALTSNSQLSKVEEKLPKFPPTSYRTSAKTCATQSDKMSWTNSDPIQVPDSYVTPKENHIRISNHPETSKGVTPIQIIALNRPDKLGAITGEMLTALMDFLTTVTVDDRVKVIIFTGTGRVFSAGIDLNSDASTVKNIPTQTVRDPGGTLALAMYNCSKTIIVAYNGMSVGIGMTSTLAAAIR